VDDSASAPSGFAPLLAAKPTLDQLYSPTNPLLSGSQVASPTGQTQMPQSAAMSRPASLPAGTTDAAVKKMILDKIASGEAPDYQTIYGGSKFNDFTDHPRQYIPIGDGSGKFSSAAGRYQFLASTWDNQARKLGLKDFSPANQDTAALDLAQTEYKRKTGRDLIADTRAGTTDWRALGNQWASLKNGGSDPKSAGATDVASGGGQPSNSSVLAGAPGAQVSSPDLRGLQALQLMKLLAPQHKFVPVDYDPWKLAPKLG